MYIGIDLGTTFSAAAYIKNNEPKIIINSDGDNSTPSVVMFSDEIIVGSTAKEQSLLEPELVVSSAKDFMGTNKCYSISGHKYSPEEVSACVLKKIVKDAESYTGEKVDGVVVTIPAYFTDAQRKATEDACDLAELNLIGMINEPTAAALCYVNEHNCNNENILVYDLGGGTFDASIVTFENGKSRVIATGGIRKLGGHFFDQLIVNYVIDYILDNHDIDLFDDEYLDVLQELSNKAENAKIKLSTANKTDIFLRIGKIKEKITITREDFEKLIDKFYRRTESTIKMVLSDAKMSFSDIDKIILVGGSSRIPYIKKCIKELANKEPYSDINPDEAVAIGAAIYANDPNLSVCDVCSHSLGIVVLNNNKKTNSIIIPRNSSIPITKSKKYVVPEEGISILAIDLTEGEGTDIEYVNIFSSIEINLPTNISKGTVVNIEFSLDKSQLLHVTAIIEANPIIQKKVHINRKSNLTEEEKEIKKSTLAMSIVQ